VSDPNRRRMLKLVRETWIDGYLKHSLDNLARIELGLEEKPDAISRPWDAIVGGVRNLEFMVVCAKLAG
jgi:hypothetical protein